MAYTPATYQYPISLLFLTSLDLLHYPLPITIPLHHTTYASALCFYLSCICTILYLLWRFRYQFSFFSALVLVYLISLIGLNSWMTDWHPSQSVDISLHLPLCDCFFISMCLYTSHWAVIISSPFNNCSSLFLLLPLPIILSPPLPTLDITLLRILLGSVPLSPTNLPFLISFSISIRERYMWTLQEHRIV